MLVKLPADEDCTNKNVPNYVSTSAITNISVIDTTHYGEGLPWKVCCGPYTMRFLTHESADAWADEVARIVNEAEKP